MTFSWFSIPSCDMGEFLTSLDQADYGFLLLTFAAIFALVFLQSALDGIRRRPPGPLSLPIIGHMHLLSSAAHRKLTKLSQKYGPIMFIWLGSVPTVVVSSPALVKEVLHHQDENFAHRPPMEMGERVMYGNRCSFTMDYNTRWRDLRKLYSLRILSVQSIQRYGQIRDEEVLSLLRNIEQQTSSPVELRRIVFELSVNTLSQVLFSKRSEDRFLAILDMVREGSKIFAITVIGDLIPYLKWFDPAGSRKKMDALFQRWDALLQKVLDERLLEIEADATENKQKDMLDDLLEFNKSIQDPKQVKASLLEILGAGIETTSATIEWVMVELLRNPKTMRKVQEELDGVVGGGRRVSEADFSNLSYLLAAMKEGWRLHPPAPLMLPHFAKVETEVGGYRLPKNTRLLVNVWAMGRDPKLWKEPEEFRPERFMTGGEAEGMDVKGRDYELIPFGTGRRGCPGIHLAMAVSTLAVANLVHSFDWKLAPAYPSSAIAALNENLGVTVSLTPPLLVIPTLRRPLVVD